MFEYTNALNNCNLVYVKIKHPSTNNYKIPLITNKIKTSRNFPITIKTLFKQLPDTSQIPSLDLLGKFPTPSKKLPEIYQTPTRDLIETLQTPCRQLADTRQTPCRHLADTFRKPFKRFPGTFQIPPRNLLDTFQNLPDTSQTLSRHLQTTVSDLTDTLNILKIPSPIIESTSIIFKLVFS